MPEGIIDRDHELCGHSPVINITCVAPNPRYAVKSCATPAAHHQSMLFHRDAVAETYGQVRAAAEPIHLQIIDAVGVDRVKERTIHDLPRDRVGVCKCSAD